MLNLQELQDSAKKFVADNATVILTAGGVVGTVATGVLAWRGGYKTAGKVEEARLDKLHELQEGTDFPKGELPDLPELSTQDKIRCSMPDVLPPIGVGVATVVAIIFSHRMSAQKAAAMAALYGVSQKQFEEYKDKVSEKITGPKQQQIKDELAQERADNTPGAQQIVIVDGQVLCFDELTGRYFRSTMEEIRKAVNDTNERILIDGDVSAGFFYDLIGLPPTSWTNEVGWNTDNMLDLEYSTIRSFDNQPAISINPRYLPHANYDRGRSQY